VSIFGNLAHNLLPILKKHVLQLTEHSDD